MLLSILSFSVLGWHTWPLSSSWYQKILPQNLGQIECTHCSSKVWKGKDKFAVVVGEQVSVGNAVQSKLHGKDLGFHTLGFIKIVTERDVNNRGVVW